MANFSINLLCYGQGHERVEESLRTSLTLCRDFAARVGQEFGRTIKRKGTTSMSIDRLVRIHIHLLTGVICWFCIPFYVIIKQFANKLKVFFL